MSSNDSLARVPYLFRAMLRHLTTIVGEILGGLSGVTVSTLYVVLYFFQPLTLRNPAVIHYRRSVLIAHTGGFSFALDYLRSM